MKKYEIGTWAEIPTPYVSDIIAKAGLDFAIIDFEHGITDFSIAQNMLFALHSRNKKGFIRVPAIEESWVARVLDTGCDGIVFPQVSSMSDIEKICRLCYFPPEGSRGFNPFVTYGGYKSVDKGFLAKENKRIEVCIILEGVEIFNHLDEIAQFSGIDIVYIGQYDLSAALGVPGDVKNARVLEMMNKTLRIMNNAGKKVGCMVHSLDETKKIIKDGYSFILYKVDTSILHDAIATVIEGVNDEN